VADTAILPMQDLLGLALGAHESVRPRKKEELAVAALAGASYGSLAKELLKMHGNSMARNSK